MRKWCSLIAIMLTALLPAACSRGTSEEDLAAKRGAERVVKVLASGYRADRGEFPRSLDQLVPQYLTKLPVNPWTGDPMKQVPRRFLKGRSEGNLFYRPILDETSRAYDFELIVFGGSGPLKTYDESSASRLGLVKEPEPEEDGGRDGVETLPLVEPLALDFGGFYRSDNPHMAVSVTNRRESFVRIVGIEPGCDCIEVGAVDREIGPGETVTLHVTIDPSTMQLGPFSHQVLIGFDGGIDPAALEVFGELVPLPPGPEAEGAG